MRKAIAAMLSVLTAGVAYATPAVALTTSDNEVTAAITLENDIEWYRYGTGTTMAAVPAVSDAYVSTSLSGSTVSLARWLPTAAAPSPTVPWWNSTFRARKCFTASASGTQYLDLRFDSTSPATWSTSGWVQANYGDVRVAVYDGTSTVPAQFWTATPFDTSNGHVLAEVAFGASPSTRTVCMYFGASSTQTATSNKYLGQNWAGFSALYINLNPVGATTVQVSNPTASNVQVSTASSGAGAITLAPGATSTITVPYTSVLYTTGSIEARGNGSSAADESLLPVTYTGTLFVSNQTRNTERWCFYGANGTSITLTSSSAGAITFPLTPASTCQTRDTTGYTTITSSAPIAVFQVTTASSDAFVVYPATSSPLYGVPSSRLLTATSAPGSIRVGYSNSPSLTVTTTVTGYNPGGFASLSTGPAVSLTPLSSQPLAALQQADSNGSETTTFLPVEAMSSRYVIPSASSYTAIACPKVGDVILVNAVPQTCAGTGSVGKLLLGATTAGTVLESQSGAAFMLHTNYTNDEGNILVPRKNWAAVTTTPLAVESAMSPSGTWVAIRSQPTQVWGLFSAAATTPLNTSVTWEIACAASTAGPFTFSAITPGDPLPHYCDQGSAVSVKATLATTDPTVTPTVQQAGLEHSMPVVVGPTITAKLVPSQVNWVWRVHAVGQHAAQTARILSPTLAASGKYGVALVDNNMVGYSQVSCTTPTATNSAAAPVTLNVSSILAKVSTAPSAIDQFVWRTTGQVWSEREFTFTG